jgi:Tat protein translocase TatC
MPTPTGEMPFLDHLEELRSRLIKSLLALILGMGLGIWSVLKFGLIDRLKVPIEPYLPDGKFTVLEVTEQFLILIKFGLVIGAVLASPIILYQIWAFLSPALYARERKALIPAFAVGLVLFLLGAWLGWMFVLPRGLEVLLTTFPGTFQTFITFKSYFGFVIQILLALGLSFELPLLMVMLAFLGVVDARRFRAFRRYAIVLAFFAGALLSPGGELTMMVVFTIPLLLLYEVGIAGAAIIQRRKRLAAGAAAVLLLLSGGGMLTTAQGQDRPPVRGGLLGGQQTRDTLNRVAGQGARQIDTATARRLGLPTGPERTFPAPDSVMSALMQRRGFAITRFLGDSVLLIADSTRIVLMGRAATDREGVTMEAERIAYDDLTGEMLATGEPRLFEEGSDKVAVGRTLRFNTSNNRAVFGNALTSFEELGASWFVRGNLAVDSSASRLYAAHAEFTSCDLPIPHYEFRAGQVKWMSQSILVARPAVLYIRDVPIVWLPFIFQDTKLGRRSGILIPQFGFNDIVRPTRGYNRQVTNIGYYWAPNDYIDATVRFDWFSSRYIQYGGEFRYRWLDRFVEGGLGVNRQSEVGGSSSMQVRWNHNQDFSAATRLRMDVNYVSDSRVLAGNAVDPLLSTQQISSSVNLTRRFKWGNATVGGTRRQSVSDGSGTMTFPTLTIQPASVTLFPGLTWSPSFSGSNETQFKTPLAPQVVVNGGVLDTMFATGSGRSTTMNMETPFDIFGFTWRNSVNAFDRTNISRRATSVRIPDLSTPEPDDSITQTTIRDGDFESGFNWETSISLPELFRQTLSLRPQVAIRNIVTGPFMLRNATTRGEWVQQGKRLEFGLEASPDLYGFLGGIGPISRFRHKFSPNISLAWSPQADISEEYAAAISRATGEDIGPAAPARLSLSIGLSQDFHGKPRQAVGDTTDPAQISPITLLSVRTSPFTIDFEQAKLPGRTGFTTAAITNALSSELIPGFNVSMTHDLWEGRVGTDTARFSPFLSNVQANLSLTSRTFRSIGAFLGLGSTDTSRVRSRADTGFATYARPSDNRFRPGSFAMNDASLSSRQRGVTASLTYSLSRQRPSGTTITEPVPTTPGFPGEGDPFGGIDLPSFDPGSRSNLGLNLSFSPTTFWSVSWQTQFNITDGRFESHQIQLQRDLHDWRASFDFARGANGNFALFFRVHLLALPEVKFDYNQTTLQQQP